MTDTTVVPVGRKAPEFSALDDRGQRVALADFKGRFVVLFFYPKDDTPG
jgi:peroxiredoxin Q/BCP